MINTLNSLKHLVFAVFLLTSYISLAALPAPTEQATQTEQWQEVVEYAKSHLPQSGTLLMKSDGFAYIKVDDAYIHELLPLLGLEGEGYREPPYFRSKEAPGAHISVFYEDEHVLPDEIGQNFSFTLEKIVVVQPGRKASYVVLQVKSPELEALRQKYHLSPKLHGHEFHITLGKKTNF